MPSPFVSEAVSLASPFGPLLLGVVNAERPGVAEGISRLLVRSIQDAREANDGHLPGWLVDDIEKNYISPAKIRTLWAATGHRFCVTHEGEIIGTIHVAKRHDVILTIDRHRVNVPAADHPGFKPERFHHVVNISVLHEVRRAGVGSLMVDGIVARFRHLFDGDGLWVRADPPWHAGLAGLGFEHDPSMDVFLPEDAEKTAGLPHAASNRRWACECRVDAPAKPEALAARRDAMATKKLQYVSFTRRFDGDARAAARPAARPRVDTTDPTRDAFAQDFGGVHVRRPTGVATPRDADELAALLVEATIARTPVTIRGGGQSTEGQSLGDDLVVSTAALDRVLAIEPGRVTVQGGVRWSALLDALGDAMPPVVPGWLDATVGGSVATAGFGKGSHRAGTILDHVLSMLVVTGDGRVVRCSPMQAGWLFDAVGGGFGQFGVVAEVTLRTVPRPRVRSSDPVKKRVLPNEIAAALDCPDAFHTMAFASKDGPWVVRVDGATPSSSAVATPPPRLMLQFLAPASALSVAYATITHSLDWAHDTLVVHAIRRGRQGSLVPAVEGDTAYALSTLCAGRPNIEHEHRAIAMALRNTGAVPTLFGVPPRDANEWRLLLGDRHDAVLRAKRMADPVAILGSPTIALPSPTLG